MSGWISQFNSSLKSIEVEEVFDLIVYRPLAFLFVKIIYRTNLTPNQITFASMIFGIWAGVAIAFNSKTAFIIAALSILLYDVLDCSDGQLARLKHNGTHLGRILDGFADYIVSIAAYVGIGIGFASNSESPTFWWTMTALAGISNAVQSGLLDYYRTKYLDHKLNRISILEEELQQFKLEYEQLKKISGRSIEKIIINIYLHYSLIQSKIISANKNTSSSKNFDRTDYVKKNKKIIHFWTYLGPTTQWSFLIITCLIGRIDIYLLGLVIAGNLLAVIMFTVQYLIDRNTLGAK